MTCGDHLPGRNSTAPVPGALRFPCVPLSLVAASACGRSARRRVCRPGTCGDGDHGGRGWHGAAGWSGVRMGRERGVGGVLRHCPRAVRSLIRVSYRASGLLEPDRPVADGGAGSHWWASGSAHGAGIPAPVPPWPRSPCWPCPAARADKTSRKSRICRSPRVPSPGPAERGQHDRGSATSGAW